MKNAGLHFPRHRIVVNLAPASVRKEGPAYDLPIALGVIMLAGFLPQDVVDNTIVIGELSLDGILRHTRGVLPMAATARSSHWSWGQKKTSTLLDCGSVHPAKSSAKTPNIAKIVKKRIECIPTILAFLPWTDFLIYDA